jgi:cathepsin D
MAFPALSNLNQDPFFTTATKQKAVSQSVFGFKLAANGSELFLGGTNKTLFTGNLEFHKVDPKVGFWQVPGASVTSNGKKAASNFETIIDSGTT